MYEFLDGIIEQKQPTRVVLNVNNIGYNLKISLSTFRELPAAGKTIRLRTYLHVREDVLDLYGFADETEREVFLSLIAISGIGPKLAQTILSGLTPPELVAAIRQGDEQTLNSISGVGKKTAQRLVVELRSKFEKWADVAAPLKGNTEQAASLNSLEREALMALMSLGYKKPVAERALQRAQKDKPYKIVEDLLKAALQAI